LARVYIAFIECVFDDAKPAIWKTLTGFPLMDALTARDIKKALANGARVSLVDIKNDRRYFSFNEGGEVHIVSNVLIFDDEWSEELAIDEDKQFPKKKRIDE